VRQWASRREEFVKRAAFALIWSLSVHDKAASDATFLACLPLVEAGARDERNFVRKAVDMALRAVGKRNGKLNAAALELAGRLAASDSSEAQWVGRSALRELEGAAVRRRVARASRAVAGERGRRGAR
jgi:3-methyladenine DNA glycosylase AlkD